MFAAALVEKLSTILMGKNPQIWILALYILEKKCLYEYNHEIIFEHLDMNHDTITLQSKTNILLRTAIFTGQLIFLKKKFLTVSNWTFSCTMLFRYSVKICILLGIYSFSNKKYNHFLHTSTNMYYFFMDFFNMQL